MKWRVEIREAEPLPSRLYGRAYRVYDKGVAVFYVWPLHWVARFLRGAGIVWDLTRGLRPTRFETEMKNWARQVERVSYEMGKAEGFDLGRTAATKAFLDALEVKARPRA